jgi:hypothetical protein
MNAQKNQWVRNNENLFKEILTNLFNIRWNIFMQTEKIELPQILK